MKQKFSLEFHNSIVTNHIFLVLFEPIFIAVILNKSKQDYSYLFSYCGPQQHCMMWSMQDLPVAAEKARSPVTLTTEDLHHQKHKGVFSLVIPRQQERDQARLQG